MDCTLDHHLIEGYLDGELGFERSLEVEAHLACCRACALEVQSWKHIRGVLQAPEFYHRAAPALEEEIRRAVSPHPWREQGRGAREPRATSRFSRWLWAGGGAAFATAALLIALSLARPFQPSSDQELVTSHVRSLMANHLMDVVSTDQHTVKPWFDGKLDFAPPVRDLAQEGYPLGGGRLDYLDNRTAAVLVYHRALHPINLYIWPASDGGERPFQTETVHGYNVVSWKKGSFEFRAVSDLNLNELGDFARRVGP